MTDIADLFGEWLDSPNPVDGVAEEVFTVRAATFTPVQPLRWYYGEPVTVTYAGETYSSRITSISSNGVYYCGDQVWTPDLYPMRPDRWEPHDEPVAEWLIEPVSADAVSPDTSQPYPLDDLIRRIDELT